MCQFILFVYLPGHFCVLQYSLKELDPEQLRPPQEGAGQLQLLDRYLVPVPHDLLQVDQAAQDPQLPFTVKAKLRPIYKNKDPGSFK